MPVSRRTLPPFNALRAFEAAGRKLNFRAAADEPGVSQGAVAQQVRAPEDHPGLALTQAMPADRAGVNRVTVAEIETGRKEGSVAALRALTAAFDITMGVLSE